MMRRMKRFALAATVACATALPLTILGEGLGLSGWTLTAFALPALFIGSLFDREGFYGRGD